MKFLINWARYINFANIITSVLLINNLYTILIIHNSAMIIHKLCVGAFVTWRILYAPHACRAPRNKGRCIDGRIAADAPAEYEPTISGVVHAPALLRNCVPELLQ